MIYQVIWNGFRKRLLNCRNRHIIEMISRPLLAVLVFFCVLNGVAAHVVYPIGSVIFTSKFNVSHMESSHNCSSGNSIDGFIGLGNSCLLNEDSTEYNSDTIRSQWNPIDSVKYALRTRPFITGALDGRNSFVSADPVSIFGLRYGYDWGKVAAHTGIYGSRYIEFKGNDSMLYRFRYISSTFEYKLYRTYRYSFLCFGQVGIGATSVKSKINPIGSPDLKPMIPFELGMYGSVRLLRYFGLAAGLGTRLAILKGGTRFSGPIYTFGITYFPSAMLEDGIKVMEKLNIKVPSVLE